MTPEACQTGIAEDDEYAKPPMTSVDALCALVLIFGAWGIVAALLVALGVRL